MAAVLGVTLPLSVVQSQVGNAADTTVSISTADVSRFLGALDALRAAANYGDSATILWNNYYRPATPGLRAFIALRIGSPYELLDKIRVRRLYYDHLRISLAGLPAVTTRLGGYLDRFRGIYPDIRLAPVWFVVGRMSSGGTTDDAGLLIGAEMYGRDADAPASELNDWERAVLRDTSLVPTIVVHELVHVNQERSGSTKLLASAIREGSADFLAEMVTGRNINAHVHAWAAQRERELWNEFIADMQSGTKGRWFGGQSGDRPSDLGYFIGYRVAKAFYDRAGDKRSAIRAILAVSERNAEQFLAESGYVAAARSP